MDLVNKNDFYGKTGFVRYILSNQLTPSKIRDHFLIPYEKGTLNSFYLEGHDFDFDKMYPFLYRQYKLHNMTLDELVFLSQFVYLLLAVTFS